MGIVATIAILIPIVAIIGGFAVAIVSMTHESRLKELRIQERIAMIEKGLVPPPEQDPAGFERALSRHSAVWEGGLLHPAREAYALKCTRAGVILIGIGLSLIVLIGIAGSATHAALGVGGGIAVLGVAFLVCGYVERLTAPRESAPFTADEQPAKPHTGGGPA